MKYLLLFIYFFFQNQPLTLQKAEQIICSYPQIKERLAYKYSDHKTQNELLFVANPTKKSPYYHFEIRQIQYRINHSVNLKHISIHINTKKVYFYDTTNDKMTLLKK
jgi:hypothetical protein